MRDHSYRDLNRIRLQTLIAPQPVLDILAEMIASDSDLKISSGGQGSYTGSSGPNLSDMPTVGLD